MSNDASNTVYAMFIGTNDLGNNAFLTDSQVRGKLIPDYIDCVYSQLDKLYHDAGARYFVLMNNAPLQLTPLYGMPNAGGDAADPYWPQKASQNATEVSFRMWEQVVTVNEVFDYRTPYAALLSRNYPGAKFAVMDIYSLLTDIYDNPAQYLNGTAPPNVTGVVHECEVSNSSACTTNASPDSFLWYDTLHPSEQTDRIIAEEFVNVVKGRSKYATYWSAQGGGQNGHGGGGKNGGEGGWLGNGHWRA